MEDFFEHESAALRQKLLTMADRVGEMARRAVRGLLLRQPDLAARIQEADNEVDRYEKEIDELAVSLLSKAGRSIDLRLLMAAMRISNNLERVGDEATTIARRAQAMVCEPLQETAVDLLGMSILALGMLKDAVTAFMTRDPDKARTVLPRDEEVDFLHKRLHSELKGAMIAKSTAINSGLNLMVISKSLERIADHAANVAEQVVYLYEGRDIRHAGRFLDSAVLSSLACPSPR